MKNKNLNKYVVISILPIVLLISMTLMPLITYFKGQDIILQTKPFDPRDAFRGDYVYLDYKINDIDINKAPKEFKNNNWQVQEKLKNKKIYAVLKKTGDFYEVDYTTFKKPKSKLFLNAKYDYTITNWEEAEKKKEKEKIMGIRVSYNLDKYFVPENTGKRLEDLSRKGQLKAKVRIYNGYAVLEDIY